MKFPFINMPQHVHHSHKSSSQTEDLETTGGNHIANRKCIPHKPHIHRCGWVCRFDDVGCVFVCTFGRHQLSSAQHSEAGHVGYVSRPVGHPACTCARVFVWVLIKKPSFGRGRDVSVCVVVCAAAAVAPQNTAPADQRCQQARVWIGKIMRTSTHMAAVAAFKLDFTRVMNVVATSVVGSRHTTSDRESFADGQSGGGPSVRTHATT